MRARVGIWHERLVVFLPSFHAHAKPSLQRDPGSGLGLLQIDTGMSALPTHRYSTEMEESGYPWVCVTEREPQDGFARCSLMDIALEKRPYKKGGYTCLLPPDHKFPWPHVKHCSSYDIPAELHREAMTRRKIASELGGRLLPPPASLQQSMTKETRVLLFTGV